MFVKEVTEPMKSIFRVFFLTQLAKQHQNKMNYVKSKV